MKRLGSCAVAGLLLLLAPLRGDAQSVLPGERVRVTVPSVLSAPQVGRLVSLDSVTLVLESDVAPEGTTQQVVPLDLVRSLEVSRGTRGNVLWGALIGGGLGFVGTLVGLSSASCAADTGGNLCVMAATFIGLGGAAVGGLIGATVRTEKWTPATGWR